MTSSKRLTLWCAFVSLISWSTLGLSADKLPGVPADHSLPYRAQPALRPGSLCAANESIVFSCTAKRSPKIISLCTSTGITKERGYIQYRFGVPGKVELEYPGQREGSQRAFKYRHYFRARVDQTEIEFSVDGYRYSVFDDYNGEEKPAIARQGVTVTPPGDGKEVTFVCGDRASVRFVNLEDFLPQIE